MKKVFTLPSYRLIGLILGVIVWLANSGNPPNGNTGAPFNGSCNNCHSGGSFSGNVSVTGLPGTIEANTNYNLTITLDPTVGNPNLGGFQLVVVDNNNANAGNLTATNGESGTEMFGGREYIDHRGSKTFGGGPISWDFDWTAPASAGGNTIKFYFIGNFTNGNGNTSGDNAIAQSVILPFQVVSTPVNVAIGNFNNISCNGGNDGSITAEPTGGTPPYTYLWSNGQTGQTAVNLTAGNYTVTVTDQGGSTGVASKLLTQPTAINVVTSVSGPITCNQPTVNLTASATGGVGPYQYEWPNGLTGQTVSVNAPGVYTVTVMDNNNCTKTGQVTVTSNAVPPTASASTSGSITCVVSTVTLSGQGSSTGPNFIYNWTTTNGNILSGSTTLSPVVNKAGTYTLTVLNVSNGCTSTASTDVIENKTPPAVTAGTSGKLNCADTSVTLTAASTPSNSTFAWFNPNNAPAGTGTSIEVNAPGVYSVIGTLVSNGCKDTTSVTVMQDTVKPTSTTKNGVINCTFSEDTLMVISDSTATFQWSGPGNFMSTADTIIVDTQGLYFVTVTAVNGCTVRDTAEMVLDTVAPPLTVTNGHLTCLMPTDTLVASSDTIAAEFSWSGPFSFNQTGDTVSVTQPGIYLVTATAANGCTTVDTALVNKNPNLVSQVQGQTNVSCFGGSNGSVTLEVKGGLQPYSVLWSTGAFGNPLTNLPAGNFSWTVTDAEGCISSGTVVITQPPVLAANASATPEMANGANDGTATAQPSGGTPSYTYLWNTNETTQTIQNLAPGNYTVTVTDAKGCTVVQSVTVNPFNCAISSTVTKMDVSCFGGNDGAIILAVTTQNEPVQYEWSTSDTTASITNLPAGTYSVTATDASGCVVQQNNIQVLQPAMVVVLFDVQHVACLDDKDGRVDIEISGGTPPYTFSLPSFENLGVGAYSVTIIDMNGCVVLSSFEIEATDSIAPTLVCPASMSVCEGDSVFYDEPVLSDNCDLGGAVPVLTEGLPSGSAFTTTTKQTFTATDALGNVGTCTFTVTATPPPMVSVLQVVDDVDNKGAGSIDLGVDGGSGNLGFSWTKDGAPYPETTEDLSGLFAGVYAVAVVDLMSGCEIFVDSIEVDNIVDIEDLFAAGNIKLMPNPVLDRLTINWADFEPVEGWLYDGMGALQGKLSATTLMQPVDMSNLPSGWYTLLVIDAKGRNTTLRFVKNRF